MKNESIKKINVAGLIGHIATIILSIVVITGMVITAIAAVAAVTVSKDEVDVNVVSEIKVSSAGDILDKLNSFISVDGIDDLTALEEEAGDEVWVDDADISSIKVTKGDDGYVINAKTNETSFSIKKVIAALTVSFVTLGAVAVALHMLNRLMKALSKCETPFAPEVIQRMTRFANALIPAAVLGMVCDGMWSSLGSGDFSFSFNIGSVLLVAVVYLLVVVFRYGAQLQRESDETL